MQYIVDVTKPPIGPPNRSINTWFGETKESLQRATDWDDYIKEYSRVSRALDRGLDLW